MINNNDDYRGKIKNIDDDRNYLLTDNSVSPESPLRSPKLKREYLLNIDKTNNPYDSHKKK